MLRQTERIIAAYICMFHIHHRSRLPTPKQKRFRRIKRIERQSFSFSLVDRFEWRVGVERVAREKPESDEPSNTWATVCDIAIPSIAHHSHALSKGTAHRPRADLHVRVIFGDADAAAIHLREEIIIYVPADRRRGGIIIRLRFRIYERTRPSTAPSFFLLTSYVSEACARIIWMDDKRTR